MPLIDADKLKKSMERMLCAGKEPDKERYTCDVVCCVIDEAPSVDAEPVIHAKWIEDGYYEKPSVCSHCGEEAFYTSTFRELSDYDWDENLISLGYEEDREYILTKWCPHCGAKMDGGKKNAVD